ncbi:hypothetical protein JG688_00002784 [Phytophthora aleatoria]|uniref:Uncharacterized protein n=1 Tax=Phytophthora aleatoria TaxID=2496075 RepID=A0A8J5JBY2_9STRA|nr:hypothetical protein JG688_00002784 [Phytophthora aleatoria]
MMKGIIGSKPSILSDTLPHLSIVIGQTAPTPGRLEVTERQMRVLRERDLNLDALNVVNLLARSVVTPAPQKRKRGEWVDENYSGGELLNYEMILAAVKATIALKP